jgi:methionyl-tRNA formyltransferase
VRVVFWGTSGFAVPSLRALIGEGFDVAAVVTQPDRRR